MTDTANKETGVAAGLASAPPSRRSTVRGGLSMGLAQLAKSFLQFLSVILLARLLQPRDFGLAASISPLTSFIVLFQDLGLQQMLVQRKTVNERVIGYVFWVTVAIGAGCAAVVLLASPFVAWFYGEPRLRDPTMLSAVVVMAGSLCAAPMGVLNRAMRFHTIAGIYVVAAAAGLGTALLTAALGGRYWALVLSPAASAVVTLAGAWWASWLRPGRPDLRKPEAGLLSFGANLTGFALLNYFARNLDNILIGRYAGSVALGFYDQAYKLLLFPLYTISNPLAQVMVPVLSRMQDDKARLRSTYVRITTQLTLFIVPGVASVTVAAPQVIHLLYGERWMPVAPIFMWLGLAGLIQPLNNSSGWLFISQARTRAMFRWGGFSGSVAVMSFVIGLHWGAIGVAAAYAMSEYVRTPFLYVLLQRVGPVSVADLCRVQAPPLAAALCMFAVMHGAHSAFPAMPGLLAIAAALVLSYTLSLLFVAATREGRAALLDGRRMLLSAL